MGAVLTANQKANMLCTHIRPIGKRYSVVVREEGEK